MDERIEKLFNQLRDNMQRLYDDTVELLVDLKQNEYVAAAKEDAINLFTKVKDTVNKHTDILMAKAKKTKEEQPVKAVEAPVVEATKAKAPAKKKPAVAKESPKKDSAKKPATKKATKDAKKPATKSAEKKAAKPAKKPATKAATKSTAKKKA